MSKNKIRILLDRSGSMESKWDSTLEAIQEFSNSLGDLDAELSLYAFDAPNDSFMIPISPYPIYSGPGSGAGVIPLSHTGNPSFNPPFSAPKSIDLAQEYSWFTNIFIGPISKFTKENITVKPRGMTALNDALGKFLRISIENAGEKNILVIMTDGAENSSKEFSLSQIRNMIDSLDKSKFEMVWLGAEFKDVHDQSKLYGNISTQSIDAGEYSSTFRNLAATTSAYFG